MGRHEQGDGGYRVLVVDDQTSIRDLLEHRLETEGFDVEAVSDGRGALEVLAGEERRFDAVVLDVSMPNMDGFETLRRIQRLERPPLVVMASGRTSEREQIRAFELGVVDYVTKPFKPRVLVARLRSHLDRERRRRQPETEEQPRKDDSPPGEAEPENADSGDDTTDWPNGWVSRPGGE